MAAGASLQYGPTDEYGVAHGAPKTTMSAPRRRSTVAAGSPRKVSSSVALNIEPRLAIATAWPIGTTRVACAAAVISAFVTVRDHHGAGSGISGHIAADQGTFPIDTSRFHETVRYEFGDGRGRQSRNQVGVALRATWPESMDAGDGGASGRRSGAGRRAHASVDPDGVGGFAARRPCR